MGNWKKLLKVVLYVFGLFIIDVLMASIILYLEPNNEFVKSQLPILYWVGLILVLMLFIAIGFVIEENKIENNEQLEKATEEEMKIYG